jgi:hypothetical protein
MSVRTEKSVFRDTDRLSTGAYSLHHQNHRPDGGGSKYLRNVGQFLRAYKHKISDDSLVHTTRSENLRPHEVCSFSYFVKR